MSYVLFIVLMALQVSDAITKGLIIAHGAVRLVSPLTRFAIDRLGPGLALALPKTGILAAVGYMLLADRLSSPVLAALCGFYMLVLWRNWRAMAG